MQSVPKRWLSSLVLLISCLCLEGCYYAQAVGGHWSLMRQREPIDAIIANSDTDPALREQLATVLAARAFAISDLGLPDNGSYLSYVALEHDYVVVNVFAAPEFSLAPKRWCYPFVGCTAYRGYFSAEKAERYAEQLSADGWDTATSRVRAYSTLGRFRDPVLSTMLSRGNRRAVELIFHEMAHQIVYVPDDTAFNESFATFVAAEGWRRWQQAQGEAATTVARPRVNPLRERIRVLRNDLEGLYGSDLQDTERRTRKAALFEQFAADWQLLGGRSPAPANNAELVPIALYADLTGAFEALLAETDGDLERFYERVRALAEMDAEARLATLPKPSR